MKVKIRSLCLFLLLVSSALAPVIKSQSAPDQSAEELPNPFQMVRDNLKFNNYLTPLLNLHANEEKYLGSKMKVAFLEWIIQMENSVGNYDEAYRYEDILYTEFPTMKNIVEQYRKDFADIKSSPLADFQMIDAVAGIDAAASREQVVMINEEHRTPFHRALTARLLSALYARGFRYFAAETVSDEDAELNARGYPVQKTGTYTADPLYADAIRTALKLGYKIVPYETADRTCQPPADNPEFCTDKRERDQARNLFERTLKIDPQAKVLVHVGRGHNSKAAISKEFNFMAYYFREISGVEPFTIDQLRFSERRSRAMEHPLYRLLTKENLLKKPSVYQSADKKFYTLGSGYDMVVFHPRLSYENGRATFLQTDLQRQAAPIDLKKLRLKFKREIFDESDPILIQAFYARESAGAVPVDQIILRPQQKILPLALPQGKFRIIARDKTGKILSRYEINVS